MIPFTVTLTRTASLPPSLDILLPFVSLGTVQLGTEILQYVHGRKAERERERKKEKVRKRERESQGSSFTASFRGREKRERDIEGGSEKKMNRFQESWIEECAPLTPTRTTFVVRSEKEA